MTTPRLAIMLSGAGRTFQSLAEHIDAQTLNAEIPLVIASRDCAGAHRAQERNIHTEIIPGQLTKKRLRDLLQTHSIDWVILAGYLHLTPIPEGFEHRIVNIHPSLLPSFGGPGMHGLRVHNAVLNAGCKVSGATVHLCDNHFDTGPILAQRACEVRDNDTPETLANRVFNLELELLPETLSKLFSGKLSINERRAQIIET